MRGRKRDRGAYQGDETRKKLLLIRPMPHMRQARLADKLDFGLGRAQEGQAVRLGEAWRGAKERARGPVERLQVFIMEGVCLYGAR